MTVNESLEIVILADNYVDKPMLVAEHGFSCLIEYNGLNILFDAGQGFSLRNNFKKLCNDKKIDFAVLSHGHYDHSDGFKDFDVSSLDIYAHKKVFAEHLRKGEDDFEFIGVDKTVLNSKKYNFILNENFCEIKKYIFLSGAIDRVNEFDVDKNLYLKTENGISKDNFPDEQYLVIKTSKGLVIFTGCSHSGIENIILDIKRKIKETPIYAVIGGFHLFRSSDNEIMKVADFLLELEVKIIITGHCTGINGFLILKNILKDKVLFSKVGLKLKII
ncbi:MBL fold metallo-hydrolase [Deferribacteraceae bacterium V6Fe1]|jgi:7,8-dihydropterin-6-yl-methyl-4-(beta-D-ribofuranosyl)aminobenzene 5'-phosphate synthase|nr:MBL fold metallo-hydrolase [Deferribacteraceae bacterium V6Fe1]